ncbi:MAG: hypothetical protein RLZZ500_1962 [Bacteroidota bacterium]|jgi:cell division protein FtsQ
MKIVTWTNIRLVLILGLAGFLYAFAQYRNGHRTLKKTEVVFVGENANFVRQETVNKLLIENKTDLQSIHIEQLNLDKLESSVNQNPMIEKSEVYVSVDGVLRAEVIPRTPVARYFGEYRSFYIDRMGNTMPLSRNHTARVPLVVGNVNKKTLPKLARILKQIHEDDFLKKNIIGVKVLKDESLEMTSRNYSYTIEFGKMIRSDRKFKNYKAFFQKAVLDSTIEKYKRINLRFTKQVVCTR